MHNYAQKRYSSNPFVVAALVGGIIAGGTWIYFLKGITTGFDGSEYTNLYYGYFSIGTMVMSGCMFLLVYDITSKDSKYEIRNIIRVVSDNTLGIYYIHCLLLGAVSYYIYPYIQVGCILTNVLKAIIVVIICLGITLILKHIPMVGRIL